MNNVCQFSPDRAYRYSLEHVMEPLLPAKRIVWIGLNPSTADESKLDNTLRRIRAYSLGWGFTSFVMTNLFAFRATQPSDMKHALDPVGPDNDSILYKLAHSSDKVVACWGGIGRFKGRDESVVSMLQGVKLYCLGKNTDGSPKHPLYQRADSKLVRYAL